MSPRFLNDEQLRSQCREDNYRSGGPGGQKRQKTSNGVRLVHEPSGLAVTATESRSLAENRMRALRRMRLKLATDLREPVDLLTFEPPDWFLEIRRGNRIEASHRHPFYAPAAGLVLDLLEALAGNPSHVAANLGVSTTTIIKLLESDSQLWTATNRIRLRFSLPALTPRR